MARSSDRDGGDATRASSATAGADTGVTDTGLTDADATDVGGDPLRPSDHIDSVRPGPSDGAGITQPKLGPLGYLRFFWRQLTSMKTALFLLMLLAVAAIFWGGIYGMRIVDGKRPAIELARKFAHAFIPIALAYLVAHYFSLLLLDGQTTWILVSNPFAADGVDLFGSYGNAVDFTAVSTDTIAYVQVGGVIAGHVVGVVLAHEQALRAGRRARASDQLPLVVVMVAFTVFGLGLLFGF